MILTGPVTIADGAAQVFDVSSGIRFSIFPASGTTATYSRVDSKTAASHDTTTTAVTALTAIDVDWPFFRVSSAGGATRVALV